MDPWIAEFHAWLQAAHRWRDRGQYPVHDPSITPRMMGAYLAAAI